MEPADYFLLRLDRCWATQFPQPTTEGLLHDLLLNGSEQLPIASPPPCFQKLF